MARRSRSSSTSKMSRRSSSSSTSKKKPPPLDFKKLYYPKVQRELLPDILRWEGDFLWRRANTGGHVLSVNHNGTIQHFKFDTNAKTFYVENKELKFPTMEALISHYYESEQKLMRRSQARLLRPVYNTFALIDADRLQFKEQLAKSEFGEVWKAILLPEREAVAIKALSGSARDQDRADYVAEARLMAMMDHENIVKLKGLSFLKQQPSEIPRLLMVLEFCNYGSLDKLLEKGLVEDFGKVRALLDSAKGVEYLHKLDIIHREIASRNCLVMMKSEKKYLVKIADFRLSRLAPDHYEMETKRRLPIFSTSPDSLQSLEWTTMSDV